MMRGKWLLVMFAWLALVSFLGGCGSSPSRNEKGLVINLPGGDVGLPTPYRHYPRGPGIFKMQLIFDSLLERGEAGYIPGLAEKWDVSPDGKTYTFYLRQPVRWHDGKPLTAEDVVFSFRYCQKHPTLANELVVDGKPILEVAEALDEKTVRLVVKEAQAPLLGRLGQLRILPQHIWKEVENPQAFVRPEALVGSGPYQLKAYEKETGAYQFEAAPEYWGAKAAVRVLQFIPVSDSVLAFDKGEIDLISVPPDIVSKYQEKKEFTVRQNPPFWGYCLLFNMEKRPELREVDVRRAFAHAVNLDELIAKVARGAAVAASPGYLPKGHVWHNSNIKKYVFDLEKAKQLLNGREISFTLLTGSSNEELRIAELIKLSCEQAGIHLQVRSLDGKSRDAAIQKQEYELALNGYGGWGGDADVLRTLYASVKEEEKGRGSFARGVPGYCNSEVDDLCEAQLREMNEEKRKALIMHLQEVLATDLPRLPLYNTAGYIVYRPAKYNGWRYMFDHHEVTHNKQSYLE